MEREVVYTAVSLLQLEKINTYLLEGWGSRVTDKFILEFRKTVNKLSKNPDIGVETEAGRLSFPVRMYRVHYQFDEDIFEVAFIQDMRSNKEMIVIE